MFRTGYITCHTSGLRDVSLFAPSPWEGKLKRRAFIPSVGATLTVWPYAVRAQQAAKMHRLAIFAGGESIADLSGSSGLRHWREWNQELHRLGYAEGRNLLIYRRSTEGDWRRASEIVREIVDLKPDVIFTPRQDASDAIKDATTTIPIVAITSDPVRLGYAASLARPGGNITGFAFDTGMEIYAKRLALLKEAVPGTSRVAQLTL